MTLNHCINHRINYDDLPVFQHILKKNKETFTETELILESRRFQDYLDRIGGLITTTSWAISNLKKHRDMIPTALHKIYYILS